MRGAQLIREVRKRAGLTQAELAARVGTTQSAIARLEGGSEPSVRRLAELVAACGLELRVSFAPAAPPIDEVPSPDVGVLRALAGAGSVFVAAGATGAALRGVPVDPGVPVAVPDAGLAGLERLAAALDEMGARLRTDDGTGSLPFDRSVDTLRGRRRWQLVTADGEVDLDFEPAGTRGYRDLRRDADRIGGIDVAALADIARHLDAEGANLSLVARVRAHLGAP